MDLDSIYTALRNADKAGDKASATKIAAYISSLHNQSSAPQAQLPAASAPTAPPVTPTNPGNTQQGNLYAMGPFGPGLSSTMGTQAAQQVGTPTNASAPYDLRNRLSLEMSPNPQQVVDTINQKFGGQKVGSIGPQGPQYQLPGQKAPTLVNPPSLPLSHLPTLGGTMDSALDTIGGTIGGAGAGLIAKNPWLIYSGGVAGVGAGQYISNLGKNIIGKYVYGLPDSDIGKQQGKDVLNSLGAAGSQAVFSSVGVLPKIGNYIHRGSLGLGSTKALQRVLDSAINAKQGLENFYSLVGNAASHFDPSISELVPSETELGTTFSRAARQEGATTGAFGTGVPLINDRARTILRNMGTLVNAWRAITDQFKPNAGFEQGEGTTALADAVSTYKATQKNALDLQRTAAANQLKSGLGPLQSPAAASLAGVDALSLIKKSGEDQVNKAWGDVKVGMGVPESQAYGPPDFSEDLDKAPKIGISDPTRTAFTNMWKQGLVASFANRTHGAGLQANQIWDAIPNEFFHDDTRPRIGLIWDEPNTRFMTDSEKEAMEGQDPPFAKETNPQMDMRLAVDDIKERRAGIRQQFRSNGVLRNPDAQKDMAATKILRDNITASGPPNITSLLENAENETTKFHDNFNHGILKEVDNKYAGLDTPVYDNFLNKILLGGNPYDVAHLGAVLKNHPFGLNEAHLSLFNIMDDALSRTTPQNVGKTFAAMKEKMGPAMDAFFGPKESAKINSYEDLVNKVDSLNTQYKNFERDWKNQPYGDIPPSSKAITNLLVDPKTPSSQAAGMYQFLTKERKDLFPGIQSDFASALADKVFPPNSMGVEVPNLKNMSVIMNKSSLRNKIIMFLGGDYLKNVEAIENAAKTAMSEPNAEGVKAPSVLQNLVRMAVAPPMSREGRGYTAILAWRHQAAARAIYNALKNPEGLEALINARLGQANRQQVFTTLSALRAGSLTNQLPTPTQQSNPPASDQP